MTVLTTPDQIAAFQLMTVRRALSLEARGMKMSRGRSIRSMWADKLGLTPRTPIPKFIEAIEKKMTDAGIPFNPL